MIELNKIYCGDCLERGLFWGAYHFIRPFRTDLQDDKMIDFINGKNNDIDLTDTLIAEELI